MVRKKLEITGILMVGGESRRMGRNKAFLEIDGKPLIERSLEVLSGVCQEVFISSREVTAYTGYGFKVIPDIIKGKGPLGGLYSALQQASYDYLFLAACDMPFLNHQAIDFFYQKIQNDKAVVPDVSGKWHPLHAFYSKRLLPLIQDRIYEDKLCLIDIVKECNARIVKLAEESISDQEREIIERSFWNANTPQEWEIIRKKVKPNSNFPSIPE